MKYTIESFYLDKWCQIATSDSKAFCEGVLWAKQDVAPRLAYRVVRKSDDQVVMSIEAYDEVSIGMTAGWPTAEQYERAAENALAKAAAIRDREARDARRALP